MSDLLPEGFGEIKCPFTRELVREVHEILVAAKQEPDSIHWKHITTGKLIKILRRKGWHLLHESHLDRLRGRMYEINADGEARRALLTEKYSEGLCVEDPQPWAEENQRIYDEKESRISGDDKKSL